MINIKPTIYNELKKVFNNVSSIYPSDWETFPVVQYVEENNSTRVKTDNIEQLADIRYKIDIWDKKSTSNSAIEVDKIFESLGFVRVFCGDIAEKELQHKILRYEATIDKKMNITNN